MGTLKLFLVQIIINVNLIMTVTEQNKYFKYLSTSMHDKYQSKNKANWWLS